MFTSQQINLIFVVFTIVFFVKNNSIDAQKLKYPEFDLIQSNYPDEKAVYLLKSEKIHLDIQNQSIKINSNIEEQMLILKDEGHVFASENLYYSKFNTISNIFAESIVPLSKNKIQRIKVEEKNFKTKSAISSGIFYDDSKQIEFQFPAARKGTLTHLKYNETFEDPKFLNKFIFNSYIPTIVSRYQVTVHENIEIETVLFHTDSSFMYSKEKKGQYITHTWEGKNLKAYSTPEFAPSIVYYTPHLSLRVKRYKINNQWIDVLPDVKGLYKAYSNWIKDVNQEVNPQLKAITDSLVQGIESRNEKAKRIFYWVQNNIKYVAFEDGMGGFIPREASTVMQKRYGDCKDMSSIITQMLKYANVPAYLTWIGSRKLPYSYEEMPNLSVDNHMIASFLNDNNDITFLDAVGTYTPFGFSTSFIQGKQALIGIHPDSFVLKTVPVIPAKMNFSSDTVKLRIENDNFFTGSGTLKLSGYSKLNFVYGLLNKSDDKRKEWLRANVQKGSNKFLIKDARFENLEQRDGDAVVSYTFSLNDYFQKHDNEWFMNLHLDKNLIFGKIQIEKRNAIPLEIENLVHYHYWVEFPLTKNIKKYVLPKNSSIQFNHNLFGFDVEYKIVHNKIVMEQNLFINTLLLTSEYFEDWNKMINELNKVYRNNIIISN
jgi:transglutaminase-like putative cysteine protease